MCAVDTYCEASTEMSLNVASNETEWHTTTELNTVPLILLSLMTHHDKHCDLLAL